MIRFYRLIILLLAVVLANQSIAQTDTSKPVKVAVFIPLYVDEVFDGPVYTLGKENLPKNLLPGLEFYNGVMMAVDSLNSENASVEINIYDTKQKEHNLLQVLKQPELANIGLVIACITNTTELKTFSDYALSKNIPLISATYPNYVGIRDNPFFVLLNSSFPAHLDGLFKYMQKQYASQQILAVTRKGPTEDFIKNYVTGLNKATRSTALKIRWISVDDNNVEASPLLASLDSTRENIVFVATPDENYGLNIVSYLSSNESYKVTAIGMPTWDGIKDLNKSICQNVDIVYSTPFLYYTQNPNLSGFINQKYLEKYFSRPSDMAFKGFETTYHFTRLLLKHRYNLINNLADPDFTVFNKFNFEAVKIGPNNGKPDLFENKKLYFIKKQNGNVKSII